MSGGTLDTARCFVVSDTGLSPSPAAFPKAFSYNFAMRDAVRTPGTLLLPVWPLPRSLATTCGISVDFSSSPYLDVSVQAVPLLYLLIQYRMHGHDPMRIAPFRHPRIKAYLQLPAAFRSLSRLSSAPSAKASALRPCSLNHV